MVKHWNSESVVFENCECCHHHSLFKGHNVNVNIVVLNCQKWNQCLKCQVSGHKSRALWGCSLNVYVIVVVPQHMKGQLEKQRMSRIYFFGNFTIQRIATEWTWGSVPPLYSPFLIELEGDQRCALASNLINWWDHSAFFPEGITEKKKDQREQKLDHFLLHTFPCEI